MGDIACSETGGLVDGPFGSNLPSSAYVSEGVPVIRGSNLTKGVARFKASDFVYVPRELANKLSRSLCKPNDIIFTKKGTLGQVGIIPELPHKSYLLSSNQMRLRADEKKALPEFVYYFLSQRQSIEKIIRDSEHTGVPKINLGYLKRFPILLPDVATQRAIVTTLAVLDDRIALLRETTKTLASIAQAIFKSWFVDFDPVRAKMEGRQPEGMDEETAALFPDSFEKSALAVIPNGWKVCSMSDVSTVGIGKTPPRKEQHWFSLDSNDVPWVSIKDMGEFGVYTANTSEFLTKEAVEKFNVRRVPAGTVLMSFKMTIGRLSITDKELTTNEAIAHFKLGEESPLSSEYVFLHLRNFDFSTLSSTSSIADAVNSKTVRQMPILHPAAEVSVAFHAKISPIFEQIRNLSQQVSTLESVRDTLLPRLISGQLRLPEAQEQVENALT